jgi:hypothetical protein
MVEPWQRQIQTTQLLLHAHTASSSSDALQSTKSECWHFNTPEMLKWVF